MVKKYGTSRLWVETREGPSLAHRRVSSTDTDAEHPDSRASTGTSTGTGVRVRGAGAGAGAQEHAAKKPRSSRLCGGGVCASVCAYLVLYVVFTYAPELSEGWPE